MRIWIVAGLLALSVSVAHAEDCNKFVHETDPSQWIVQTDYGLDWHKEGEVYPYEIGRYTNETPILTANTKDGLDAEMDNHDFSQYRFAQINGREALVWNMWFYYRACASTS
jgi:hypothetical protein